MSSRVADAPRQATVFAALCDPTRLALVTRLCRDAPCSIAQLASASPLTRQAITKHLRVLEGAGIVRAETIGRERVFELKTEPLAAAQSYLHTIAQQWDAALARLQAFVEKES
ncbi:MAG: ArsR/SmtB family transcription factor [Chthoniobacterales bacterium]